MSQPRRWPLRPIPHVALLTVAATVALTPVAVADDSRGGRNRVAVVPAVNVAGNSSSDLLGDHFALNMALPAAHSPFGGTANLCLSIGHRGRVLVPTGGVVVPDAGIEMTTAVTPNRVSSTPRARPRSVPAPSTGRCGGWA